MATFPSLTAITNFHDHTEWSVSSWQCGVKMVSFRTVKVYRYTIHTCIDHLNVSILCKSSFSGYHA